MALPVFEGNAKVAITDITFSPKVAAFGETVHVTAKLKNNSDHAITKIVVSSSCKFPTPGNVFGLEGKVSEIGSIDYGSGLFGTYVPVSVSWAKNGTYTLSWDLQITGERAVDNERLDKSVYHWPALEGLEPNTVGVGLFFADCTKTTVVGDAPTSSCINLNLQGTPNELLSLLSYRFNPRIELNDLRRCNVDEEEEGRPFMKYDDEGESLVTSIIALLNDPPEAEGMWDPADYGFGVTAVCSPQPRDWEFNRSVYELMGGYDTNTEIFNGTFDNTVDYTISLEISNGFESTGLVTRSIPRAFANVHLSGKETGGVAFGMFSKSTEDHPRFECRYPMYFYGGMAPDRVAKLTYKSGFKDYPGHEPMVTRVGCFVFLDGMIQRGSSASSATSSEIVVASLPKWARPRITYHSLNQGSGTAVWWMRVTKEGDILCARYRATRTTSSSDTAAYLAIPASAQLPVTSMWIAADAYQFYDETMDPSEEAQALAFDDAD